MIHPWAWMLWMLAVAVAASSTRNPLYLAIVLLCVLVVDAAVPQRATQLRLRPWPLVAGFVVLAALLNLLSVRAGRTVLLVLPEWLLLFGGPLSAEALLAGALSGLALATLLLAFLVGMRAVPVRDLIRLLPRAFAPTAVVVTIAITFVPLLVRQGQQIAEAQRVRGNRLARLRDWIPLLVPLLIGALERAFQLAESLTARGYVAATGHAHGRKPLLAGLLLAAVGLAVQLLVAPAAPGIALQISGVALVAYGVWQAGRAFPRSSYTHQRWRPTDSAVVIGVIAVLVAYLALLPTLGRTTLAYTPYPRLGLPDAEPARALLTLGLLWPLAVLLERRDTGIR